ncbi:Intermediate filament protein [Cladochytrium tenue]|nr:Intermediate filament protein [Cladochytrium tenue]
MVSPDPAFVHALEDVAAHAVVCVARRVVGSSGAACPVPQPPPMAPPATPSRLGVGVLRSSHETQPPVPPPPPPTLMLSAPPLGPQDSSADPTRPPRKIGAPGSGDGGRLDFAIFLVCRVVPAVRRHVAACKAACDRSALIAQIGLRAAAGGDSAGGSAGTHSANAGGGDAATSPQLVGRREAGWSLLGRASPAGGAPAGTDVLRHMPPGMLHPALETPAGELAHLRRLADGVAKLVLPESEANGRLFRLAVREVLALKVLRPLVDYLSSPSFWNDNFNRLADSILSHKQDLVKKISDAVEQHRADEDAADSAESTAPVGKYSEQVASCRTIFEARLVEEFIRCELMNCRRRDARWASAGSPSPSLESLDTSVGVPTRAEKRLFKAQKKIQKKVRKLRRNGRDGADDFCAYVLEECLACSYFIQYLTTNRPSRIGDVELWQAGEKSELEAGDFASYAQRKLNQMLGERVSRALENLAGLPRRKATCCLPAPDGMQVDIEEVLQLEQYSPAESPTTNPTRPNGTIASIPSSSSLHSRSSSDIVTAGETDSGFIFSPEFSRMAEVLFDAQRTGVLPHSPQAVIDSLSLTDDRKARSRCRSATPPVSSSGSSILSHRGGVERSDPTALRSPLSLAREGRSGSLRSLLSSASDAGPALLGAVKRLGSRVARATSPDSTPPSGPSTGPVAMQRTRTLPSCRSASSLQYARSTLSLASAASSVPSQPAAAEAAAAASTPDLRPKRGALLHRLSWRGKGGEGPDKGRASGAGHGPAGDVSGVPSRGLLTRRLFAPGSLARVAAEASPEKPRAVAEGRQQRMKSTDRSSAEPSGEALAAAVAAAATESNGPRAATEGATESPEPVDRFLGQFTDCFPSREAVEMDRRLAALRRRRVGWTKSEEESSSDDVDDVDEADVEDQDLRSLRSLVATVLVSGPIPDANNDC